MLVYCPSCGIANYLKENEETKCSNELCSVTLELREEHLKWNVCVRFGE